jgi:hypothetical protein
MLVASKVDDRCVCPLSGFDTEIICCENCVFYMAVEDEPETVICANPKVAINKSLELALSES